MQLKATRICFSIAVLLYAPLVTTHAEIEPTPEMSLSGRVVDERNKPVVHAGVAVLQERYVDGRKDLYPLPGSVSRTNEQGEFRFAGVWKGPVVLQFMPMWSMRVTPGGLAFEATDMAYFPAYFPGTPDPSKADQILLSPGTQRGGLEVRLLSAPTHRVRGWVRNHLGEPVRRSSLVIKPTSPAWAASLRARVVSAPTGQFEFERVPPGSYRLIVDSDDPQMAYPLVLDEPVLVRSADIDGLEVRLPVPVEIEGEMLIKADSGVRPRDVYVALTVDEEGVGGPPLPRQLTPQGDKFVFDDVLPGTYRIGASLTNTLSPEVSACVERIEYGGRELSDAPIEITARPARLRVTIEGGCGSLTGTVAQQDAGAARVTIWLLSADQVRRSNQRTPLATWTESSRFRIERIPPGEYLAFAFADTEEGFWRDPQRFKKFAAAAKSVSIAKHATVDVRLEITPLPQ